MTVHSPYYRYLEGIVNVVSRVCLGFHGGVCNQSGSLRIPNQLPMYSCSLRGGTPLFKLAHGGGITLHESLTDFIMPQRIKEHIVSEWVQIVIVRARTSRSF